MVAQLVRASGCQPEGRGFEPRSPRHVKRGYCPLTSAQIGGKMKDLMKKIGLGDSYTSLILGFVVVVVVGILLIAFVRRQGSVSRQPSLTPAEVEQQAEEQKALPKKHTVAEGENLWTIAEKYYKSGYNWVDIVQANNLGNPDVLYVGTELTIPNVEPKVPTQVTQVNNAISDDSYTVAKDDNLWDIAVRAYGDGFKWVEVAKANNLTNSDLIYAGNVLKIPR